MIGARVGIKTGPRIGGAVGIGADEISAGASAPLPTFVAMGTAATATVGVAMTPGMPAGLAVGDILVLACDNTFVTVVAPTLSDAQGFAAVPGGTINSGDFGGIKAQVTLFWRRYDGTGTAPTVGTLDLYSCSRIYAFRGCVAAGNPWDEVLVDGDNDGGNTMTLAQAGTTTGANRLVTSFVGGFTQGSAEVLSGWACAALAAITQRDSTSYALGEDVFLGCVTGSKANAGAFSDLTANWTGGGTYWVSAGVTLSLRPS